MIEYEDRWGGLSLLLIFRGSALVSNVHWGIISAAICVAIVLFDPLQDYTTSTVKHPYTHQIFSLFLGIILVFRSQISYQRFWEGRTHMQAMTSNWEQAFMQISVFDEIQENHLGSRKKIQVDNPLKPHSEWIISQSKLFSLLHATAVQRLRGRHGSELLKHDLCDAPLFAAPTDDEAREGLHIVGGINEVDVSNLDPNDATYCSLSWVTRSILRRWKLGGLRVPTPLITRPLQFLSDGMQAFMNARKIQDTPFPFPYAQLVTLFLMIFVLTTPIVIAADKHLSVGFKIFMSFCASAITMGLNHLAMEMEDPFGFDDNDLPVTELHADFVARLQSVDETELDLEFQAELATRHITFLKRHQSFCHKTTELRKSSFYDPNLEGWICVGLSDEDWQKRQKRHAHAQPITPTHKPIDHPKPPPKVPVTGPVASLRGERLLWEKPAQEYAGFTVSDRWNDQEMEEEMNELRLLAMDAEPGDPWIISPVQSPT